MFDIVQLNGLIREAEQTGETRWLAAMQEERKRQILATADEDPGVWIGD